MRQIPGILYSICEDSEYKQFFCRLDDVKTKAVNQITGEPVQLKLFCVTFPDGSTKMVLAEDDERAKGQATCKAGCNDYAAQVEVQKTLTAVQVPFRVQGWSANEY